jgi:phage-related protein
MALKTFDPVIPPSSGTGNKPEMKLLAAEFGDGYTQVAPDGMNHIRRTLTLKWDLLTPDQMFEITRFFTDHGGSVPFWYQPSNESKPVKWTCKDFDDTRANDGFQVSATFVQSFNLMT